MVAPIADSPNSTPRAQKALEIIDVTDDAFFELNHDGVVTFVNASIEQWYGRTGKEILGKRLWNEFPQIIGSPLHKAVEEALLARSMLNKELFFPLTGQWVSLKTFPSSEGVVVILSSRQKTSRAEQILDAINEACYGLDTDGKLIFVNSKAEKLSGMTKEAILGRNMSDLFPEFAHAHFEAIRVNVLEKKRYCQYEYISPASGTWMSLSATYTGDGCIVLMREIQDLVHICQNLQKEHRILSEAQPAGLVGNYEWKTLTDEIYWSDEMYRLHGLQPQSEVITLERVLSFIHPQDAKWVTELILNARKKTMSVTITHRILTADKEEMCVAHKLQSFEDENGKVTHINGIVRDITDLKRKEQELKANKDLLQSAFDTVPHSMMVLKTIYKDDEVDDFEILLCNKFTSDLDPDNLIGKRYGQIFPMHVSKGVLEKFKYVAHSGKSLKFEQECEEETLRHCFHFTVTRLDNLLVVLREDISERKRAEAELVNLKLSQQKELMKTVLQTQELERERIGEWLHNEVGQLLYAVKLKHEMLNTKDPRDINLLREINDVLEKAITETRNIAFELVPAMLRDFGLVEALTELFQRIATPRLTVSTSMNLEQRLTEEYEMSIYRMIQELINNIIKHSRATEAFVEVAKHAGGILLRVEDNGIGFDQTQTSPKGIGLKSIINRVQLLNAQLTIESEPSKGTKVLIHIPVGEQQ